MLALPTVTLICVDCVNPAAALIALRRSLAQVQFARAVLLTHEAPLPGATGVEVVIIPRLASRGAYSQFMLNELGRFVATEHALVIQWDGYVVNPAAWRSEFLEFDYIGAKWWHQDGCNVGNGGFSLRSKKLLGAVQALALTDCTINEDDMICRTSRRTLEVKHGVRFASEAVADQFAFERNPPRGPDLPFGFHGLFNMWRVLSPAELQELFRRLQPSTIAYVETLELLQEYLRQKRYEEAIWLAGRVLDFAPNQTHALKMLSVAAFRADRKWLLTQAMQELHRIDPRNPEYLSNLGDLASMANRATDAVRYYRRLLELRPQDRPTLEKLGRLEGARTASACA
jgi:tetratricopeptide (TPR) repeat protein